MEKLYKALISATGEKYPFIHDLVSLRKQLQKAGERLPVYVTELEGYTSFAAQFRYEEAPHLSETERDRVRVWIKELRVFCLERIGVLTQL